MLTVLWCRPLLELSRNRTATVLMAPASNTTSALAPRAEIQGLAAQLISAETLRVTPQQLQERALHGAMQQVLCCSHICLIPAEIRTNS